MAGSAAITWPTKVVPIPSIHYAGSTTNITHVTTALAVLTACIYPDEAVGVEVPLLELIAHGLLVVSVAGAFVAIARRRRTNKLAIADSWEPLPTSDVAVRFFTLVAATDLVAAVLAFVLMCVPVVHDGVFATCVYAGARALLARLSAPRPIEAPPQN